MDGIRRPGGDPVMVISGACQESTPSAQERGNKMRRRRFQKGSLQSRKHGRYRVWVACWWEDGSRRSSVLGRCSQMTKSDAEAALADILKPINSGVSQGPRPVYTFKQFVTDQYLPFYRKGWKESTAGTSEQIINTHLDSRVGRSSASGHQPRRFAEGSRRKGPQVVLQRGGPHPLVHERNLQAGPVGRAASRATRRPNSSFPNTARPGATCVRSRKRR